MPTPLHAGIAALKRLDTLLAAALGGYCAGSLAQARLCDDTSCSSSVGTAVYLAVVALGAVGTALVLWRYTRRWWSRAVILAVAFYAVLIVPPLIWTHGRWAVRSTAGASCVVRAGAPTEKVHRDCGAPSYGCDGPKFIGTDKWWNPVAIRVCSFNGDVYGDRLVTYDCGGLVFSVDAFGGGRRPQGCVSQR